MLSGIAAGVIALGAPAASADHVKFDCGFTSVSQARVTGDQSYEGEIHTWVAGNPGENVSIDCWLKVGGTRRAGVFVSGTTFAGTAERVSFAAAEGETVFACYTATAGSHSVTGCDEADHSEFPPPVFWETLDSIFAELAPVLAEVDKVVIEHVDPTACEVLKLLTGVYPGGIGIDSEGDVFYDFNEDGDFDDDEWVWDCAYYHYLNQDQPDGSFDD